MGRTKIKSNAASRKRPRGITSSRKDARTNNKRAKHSPQKDSRKESKSILLDHTREGDLPTSQALEPTEILTPDRDHNKMFVACPTHREVTYRRGGFCEKCYSEGTLQAVKNVDDTLVAEVINKLDVLIRQILDTDDDAVLERFLGRILSRFDKPKTSHHTMDVRAVHLHGPVDFGK